MGYVSIFLRDSAPARRDVYRTVTKGSIKNLNLILPVSLTSSRVTMFYLNREKYADICRGLHKCCVYDKSVVYEDGRRVGTDTGKEKLVRLCTKCNKLQYLNGAATPREKQYKRLPDSFAKSEPIYW